MDSSQMRHVSRLYCASLRVSLVLALVAVVAVQPVWPQPPKKSVDGTTSQPKVSQPKVSQPEVQESQPAPTAVESGAQPVLRNAAQPPADIHPASFQGITPGKSLQDAVRSKMGEPAEQENSGGVERWQYQDVGPFRTVEFWIEAGTVTAIVAKLAEPLAPGDVAQQLSLKQFQPVPVREGDELLGQAYPERGVLFSFSNDKKQPKVLQIALEPLTAEPFWLRAQATSVDQPSRILADLDAARRLGWDEPEATWLEVELRSRLAQYDEAARLAASLQATTFAQRIKLIWLSAERGELEQARTAAKRLMADAEDDWQRAQAEHLLGNLLAVGLHRDLPSAVERQTKAIKFAEPLLKDRDRDKRRGARRLLIDVHLALAHHVASGPFKDKTEVAKEWWSEAIKLAGEQPLFRNDDTLQLQLMQQILAANAQLEKPVSGEIFAKRLNTIADRLLTSTKDPLQQDWVRTIQAFGLLDAARGARKTGRFEEALDHGRTARTLLMAIHLHNPRTEYAQGCTEFVLGSIYAVYKRDHDKACGFYDQALTFFREPTPASRAHETGVHGERFVSIGVSFWETGRKDMAVQVTERGAELMEAAVEQHLMPRSALSVPYGNLAAMQESLGNEDASASYARKAAALGDPENKRR